MNLFQVKELLKVNSIPFEEYEFENEAEFLKHILSNPYTKNTKIVSKRQFLPTGCSRMEITIVIGHGIPIEQQISLIVTWIGTLISQDIFSTRLGGV